MREKEMIGMENTVKLGGHWGNGLQVFKNASGITIKYGFVDSDETIKKTEWELKDLSNEDAVVLATILLVTQNE